MSEAFFDTNIVIDWLREHRPAYNELLRYDRPMLSRIAWAEVLAGEPQDGHAQLTRLLGHFEVVELDAEIAAIAADFRYRTRVKLIDAIIYATARQRGVPLVTRNIRDFPPGLPGIRTPYSI